MWVGGMACGEGALRVHVEMHRFIYTNSPRRGLTVALTHTVPSMLDRVMLRKYSVLGSEGLLSCLVSADHER